MKKILIYNLVLGCTLFLYACSKSSKTPTPKKPADNTAQILMKGGEWGTTAATFYSGQNGQGTATAAPSNYLGDYGIFALCGVTFFSADSVKVQDYGNVPWSLSGTKPTHLNVDFGTDTDEGDHIVDAQIISLDSTTLVIMENTTFFQGYASYKQTLTAHYHGH